jgi:hypothetical protein
MQPAGWSETLVPQVTPVKRIHITELRDALAPARSAIGVPAISYSQPNIIQFVTLVKAVDVQELRQGVQ